MTRQLEAHLTIRGRPGDVATIARLAMDEGVLVSYEAVDGTVPKASVTPIRQPEPLPRQEPRQPAATTGERAPLPADHDYDAHGGKTAKSARAPMPFRKGDLVEITGERPDYGVPAGTRARVREIFVAGKGWAVIVDYLGQPGPGWPHRLAATMLRSVSAPRQAG